MEIKGFFVVWNSWDQARKAGIVHLPVSLGTDEMKRRKLSNNSVEKGGRRFHSKCWRELLTDGWRRRSSNRWRPDSCFPVWTSPTWKLRSRWSLVAAATWRRCPTCHWSAPSPCECHSRRLGLSILLFVVVFIAFWIMGRCVSTSESGARCDLRWAQGGTADCVAEWTEKAPAAV